MECRVIDKMHEADINLPNDPFRIFGRMIPKCEAGEWSYTTEHFDKGRETELCFPDENYNFDEMSKEYVFVGAYDENDKCIGLAVLKNAWFKYMYVEDLKVSEKNRRSGVGRALIEASMQVAKDCGYNGLYLVGQDNNLAACQFYIKMEFEIGGFDNRVYKGTSQEGKGDIHFYKEFK